MSHIISFKMLGYNTSHHFKNVHKVISFPKHFHRANFTKYKTRAFFVKYLPVVTKILINNFV